VIKGFSKAKINLFLHITGRRDDGYHTISSFMGFLDSLYDEIHIVKAENRSITFVNKIVPEANTISKVLDLFPGYDTNFKITAHKEIPIASGMGGGSGNAAFVLNFLKKLYNIPDDIIYELGLKVGADLPICIKGRACIVSGIGEKLNVINTNIKIPIVIINNGAELSSKKMYDLYRVQNRPFSQDITKEKFECSIENCVKHLKNLNNDLQPVAIAAVPEIQLILNELAAMPGCAFSRMSGSGPTCFGVFNSEADALYASKRLQKKYPNYLVKFSNVIS
jgi:4-diphosphocytidyl-2-C-methyl-D-erythritol kinase